MLEYIEDYSNNGLVVIDMYRVENGQCQCGNPECVAQHKHPKNTGWRTTPVSYAQSSMAFWEQFDDFAPQSCGWVLEDKHIVIDVDPRNGGMESLLNLEKKLGYRLADKSNAVVETGGGGLHFYFTKGPEVRVSKSIAGYQGIDIKTGGGFVVIAGSMHISGNTYEWVSHAKSNLAQLEPIPEDLLALCKAQVIERVVGQYSGSDDWSEALSFISPDIGYDDWIRIGMAIHHITNGNGFEQWDEWSRKSDKYDPSIMGAKWHSFGKSKNIVTEATLFHYAKEGGYVPSIGVPEVVIEQEESVPATPVPLLSKSDLLKPRGLLGELVGHINTNCLFKRKWAAVGVAMSALSTIIGQRKNTIFDTRFNLINIIVADSATGKESLITGARDIIEAVGATKVIYGGIKSEQEIYRNLIRHQVAFYLIDEFGLQLAKIKNAHKSGASYHEGTISTILSAFTKANKYLDITGDMKYEMTEALKKSIVQIEVGLSENIWEEPKATDKQLELERLRVDLERIQNGIYQPYLNICGFTTPVTFESSVDEASILQGDVGRMLIFKEYDSNPMPDMNFRGRRPIPVSVVERLQKVYNEFASANDSGRIEWNHPQEFIKFDAPETERLYNFVYQWFYTELSNALKDDGMQAVARRSPELMNKVLGLLAVEDSITVGDIQYAFSLVYYDLMDKKRIATITRGESSKVIDDVVTGLRERILAVCSDGQDGATRYMIGRKTQKYKTDDVSRMIDLLIQEGIIEKRQVKKYQKTVDRYVIVE